MRSRPPRDIPIAIDAVEAAYLEKHRCTASVWPLLFHEFKGGVRDMDLKSGNLDGMGLWGLKAISCYYDNPEAGLPVYHGTSLVFDYATGTPKALLNAMPITRYRTGAAGAIGAKWLARKDARVLAICGDGGLAPFLTAACLVCLPQIERVLAVSCGGITVRTGDVVLGDCDGVVVVPHEHEDEVFAGAQAKFEKELHQVEALRAGANTLELLGFDRIIERLERS